LSDFEYSRNTVPKLDRSDMTTEVWILMA
jgi:hypothetical protein